MRSFPQIAKQMNKTKNLKNNSEKNSQTLIFFSFAISDDSWWHQMFFTAMHAQTQNFHPGGPSFSFIVLWILCIEI